MNSMVNAAAKVYTTTLNAILSTILICLWVNLPESVRWQDVFIVLMAIGFVADSSDGPFKDEE
jgi:hypothetical protein